MEAHTASQHRIYFLKAVLHTKCYVVFLYEARYYMLHEKNLAQYPCL